MATEAEYREHMHLILMAGSGFATILESLPLDALAQTIEQAHAVAPIVDPTAYRTALADGRLDQQAAAIRAAKGFLEAWRKVGLPLASDDG